MTPTAVGRVLAARAGFGLLWWLATLLLLTGCTSAQERNPVPADQIELAEVPGIPDARFWGDAPPADIERQLKELREQQLTGQLIGPNRAPNYLALSGGGARGAFGAGLLVGWTRAGDRPEFDIVTGVSTGALIAPFAFLGSDYDHSLGWVYTRTHSGLIMDRRGLMAFLFRDSMANLAPLERLLARHLGPEELRRISAEHRRGRRLYIGTTHLDAGRPVIWNIGAMAASGRPDALQLIHRILVASALIPGAFEPLYFEVEVDGRRYDEMHVDGGATRQVFLFPAQFDWRRLAEILEPPKPARIYVIRNSSLQPEYMAVKPSALAISARSVGALIRNQGIGDLNRIYLQARRDGMEYRLAHIPGEFDLTPSEPFDPVYMKALFDLAEAQARAGYPWLDTPPGVDLASGR